MKQNDISLYYEEKGEGTPFVLLHGNGGNGGYFAKQVPVFSAEYRVITVDTRGHGKSPRGEGAFTLARFADDLNSFLDEHGINQIILLGFSDGANIAMLFALKYPERVKALILDGGNLMPNGIKASFQWPVEIGYRLARFCSLFCKAAVPKKEMLEIMVKEPRVKTGDLKAIQVPTLVIAGDGDIIKEEHTRLIADAIPGAQLCFVKGSHSVAAENPEEFNRCVLDFLHAHSL